MSKRGTKKNVVIVEEVKIPAVEEFANTEKLLIKKDQLVATAAAKKERAKKERTLEQIEADKERMKLVRAAKLKKKEESGPNQ